MFDGNNVQNFLFKITKITSTSGITEIFTRCIFLFSFHRQLFATPHRKYRLISPQYVSFVLISRSTVKINRVYADGGSDRAIFF